jgi:nucleoside 2-deoxyribosyltransferase
MKKKIYVGGELFSEADVTQRLKEGNKLIELGYPIYNPIANDDINDKSGNPTSEEIFLQDMSEVLSSDIITAPIDNEDPGLMMELGMALSGNLFMRALDKMKEELSPEALAIVDEHNPFKDIEVHAVVSDIRTATAGEYNDYLIPKGYNQFVIGGLKVLGNGGFHRSFKDLEKELEGDK